MGKRGNPYADERKLKEESIANIINQGFDPRLEHEARVQIAEDDLRAFYVDRSLAERAAARQAVRDARREEEAIAALAAPAAQDTVNVPAALAAPAAQEEAPAVQATAAVQDAPAEDEAN